MDFQEKSKMELFAVIKPEGNHVLGRIIRINRNGLTLRSASDDYIDPNPLMDIFTKGKFFFKDLSVDIVSDKNILDQNSFSKLHIREITISFNHLDCSQRDGMDIFIDDRRDAGE